MTKAQLQQKLAEVENYAIKIERQIQECTNELVAARGAITLCKNLIAIEDEEVAKQAKPPAE